MQLLQKNIKNIKHRAGAEGFVCVCVWIFTKILNSFKILSNYFDYNKHQISIIEWFLLSKFSFAITVLNDIFKYARIE